MKKSTTADDVAQDIWSLFKGEDLVQVLMPGEYPDDIIEPLDGLFLAANCLRIEPLLSDTGDEVPNLTESTKREVKIRKALTKLAKKTDTWFVVFYQLEGSENYNLGWSDNITAEQAFNAILGYIQYVTEVMNYDCADPLPDNYWSQR